MATAHLPPQLDAETNLLCAMLWSHHHDQKIRAIATYLHPTDFHDPQRGYLFEMMQKNIKADKPIDPTTIFTDIQRGGNHIGHHQESLRTALIDATTAGGFPEQAAFYAKNVLSTSYRHQFRMMALRITQAAEEAPEDMLFTIMCRCGTQQRRATERLNKFDDYIKQATNPPHKEKHNNKQTKQQKPKKETTPRPAMPNAALASLLGAPDASDAINETITPTGDDTTHAPPGELNEEKSL